VDNIKFQKVLCINPAGSNLIELDITYYAIEHDTVYEIYREPSLLDINNISTFIGSYNKDKFFNLAKWREEQIDSIIIDDK